MFEVGTICIKIAGRDSGLKCVIVEVLDNNFVLIDGQTRRRKCNVKHLEPLKDSIKIKNKASHSEVVSEFKKLKIDIKETKPKKTPERPKKSKKVKVKPGDEKKASKEKTATKEKLKKEVVEEKTDAPKPSIEKKEIKEEKPSKK